jgi:hypothetical protein
LGGAEAIHAPAFFGLVDRRADWQAAHAGELVWRQPNRAADNRTSTMPNVPFEDPDDKERTGLGTWVLVFLGTAAFIGVFIFFATRW